MHCRKSKVSRDAFENRVRFGEEMFIGLSARTSSILGVKDGRTTATTTNYTMPAVAAAP